MDIWERRSANQKRGPDVGQNIKLIIMEDELKVLIKIGDRFINPDQITHISGGVNGGGYEFTIINFIGGGSTELSGLKPEVIVNALVAYQNGYQEGLTGKYIFNGQPSN